MKKSTAPYWLAILALCVSLGGVVWAAPARRANSFNSNTIISPPSDVEDVDLSTTDWTPTQGSTNARAIYVGTTGDVKVTLIDGGTGTYHNLPVGRWSMLVTKIWKTGTTASQIEAEY